MKYLKEKIMSEMARELVQLALDQDYNKANKTFGEIMNTKLSDVLDQEQIRLANSVYNGIDPDEEEDHDETDEDILGDEEGDQLELDLDSEVDDEEEADDEEIEDEDEDLDLDDEEN